MPAGAKPLLRSPKPGGKGMAQIPRPLPADVESFAHDLRNILSGVRGYAQLLLSMAHEEKIVEYLAIIEAESSRCCELLERMLRPEKRTLRPEEPAGASASKSDAARAAEKVCDLARGEAALRGVELAWRTEGELPPAAVPQEDLERVLLNLVRNGIQATPRGGRVDLRARTCKRVGRRAGVEIEVCDTGRGVPEYARRTIFEAFFSTNNPGEGQGLGLAICSALVERCGGSIDVRSEEGAGTTLTVRLPAGEQGG